MRNSLILGALVAAMVSACESKSVTFSPDSGAPEDTAAAIDAGAQVDSGTAVDAGAPIDSGALDSGARVDIGMAVDGGGATDAGSPADVGARDAGTAVTDGAVAACMARDLGSSLGTAVATGDSDTGTTEFSGSCGGEEAPESALTWSAPSDGEFTFTTEGTDWDTVLYVNDGACDGAEIDCNDDTYDGEKGALWSSVTVSLRRGQRVTVFVDGYADHSGAWTLNIAAGGASDGGVSTDVPSTSTDVPSTSTDVPSASTDASVDVPPG